ncbi:MAG: S9 family peptidase [Pseudomonadota bacterium]
MKIAVRILGLFCLCSLAMAEEDKAAQARLFQPMDVFHLEYASDPQISPDGKHIVYVRRFMDVMSDQNRANLWMIDADGKRHRPLTDDLHSQGSPRWSPDGSRLLYVSTENGAPQLYLRWMDTGDTMRLTQLTKFPYALSWSPDGRSIAFSMDMPAKPTKLDHLKLPAKPEGANWAEPAKVVTQLNYRADGAGYLKDTYTQLFLLSAEGGTPRQLTFEPFHHNGKPAWTLDGQSLIFSSNRDKEWEYEPVDTELYKLSLADGSITELTERQGPDFNPLVSPNGQYIAYLGFDDKMKGYTVTTLYVMNVDGSRKRSLNITLDRDMENPTWRSDSRGLYFQYDDHGNTKLAYISINGEIETLASDVGGLSIGRPYSGGAFSVAMDGQFAFTQSRPDYPADIAVGKHGSDEVKRLTRLNEDLFSHKQLGVVEEIAYPSSHDGRPIQGWVAKPPNFDASKKYPLILEIHGGPFANYGDRFSAEVQLFATAGYVVLYVNPRGSTSYGDEFANLIHHNYPSEDYDDLMSGVDAVIAQGYIDTDNLFITGGSGGGVLTSWSIGKTDRFRAAVVAKPVINWYSFVLTSDGYPFYYKYWFAKPPWEDPEPYLKRSPLSLVGNVNTPTMLLTGEADYRTPMSETEQYYQALKIRKVDTAMVRIPDASHGITARPSNLISKVAHVLAWFEKYRKHEKNEGE